jgi:hypothetical protein
VDSEFSKKKALVFGALILVFVAIPVTIYTALQVQETRTQAEKATTLTLTPATQTAKIDQQVNLDVNINPGINQVDFVKLVINFDPTIFDSQSTSFTLDPNTTFQYTADTAVSNGQIIITLDVGSNPTDTVRSAQKIGTLSLLVGVQNNTQEPELLAGDTQVIFNEALIEIRSIGSTDTYQENVLSSTQPATITILADPTPTLSPEPSISPEVTPSVSPTPPVCEVPTQVKNVRINCPNCEYNLSSTSQTSSSQIGEVDEGNGCIRRQPLLELIDDAEKTGNLGEAVKYDVKVTSRDSETCGQRSFGLISDYDNNASEEWFVTDNVISYYLLPGESSEGLYAQIQSVSELTAGDSLVTEIRAWHGTSDAAGTSNPITIKYTVN